LRSESTLCVVHLARCSNGLEPYRDFLDSYRRHSPGTPHELAIVLKGFPDRESGNAYRELGADICDHWIEVDDAGVDLGAYRRAAQILQHRQLAFLNSFTVIRNTGWLETMRSIAASPGVGAVGAYGSWASHASYARYKVGLGGPYRGIFVNRARTDAVFARLAGVSPGSAIPVNPLKVAFAWMRELASMSLAFGAFPSPHLRTNCFLIDRELWLSVSARSPTGKPDAYRLESGRRGITARLTAMGLRVVVAGCDGCAYDVEDWPASNTLWQKAQQNLLVEDNQTRSYRFGDDETRHVLSSYAWGPRASPSQAQASPIA
jgi:hypothetical protein